MSSMKSHNKKRNVILMYEFLVRTISKSLLENDKKRQSSALHILKQYYVPGTELYKEFRIANALYKASVSSSAVAASILSEAKTAIRQLNEAQLTREKSSLIKDVNYKLNDKLFYDQPVGDYRIFATIQTMFNEWRTPTDLLMLAEFEDKICQHLTEARDDSRGQQQVDVDAGTLRLASKLMIKKLNEKYSILNETQRTLLKQYALGDQNNIEIKSTLQGIQNDVVGAISEQIELKSDERLLTIKKLVLDETFDNINDELVTRFLKYSQLTDELKNGMK